jgi:phenylalanyl-tRNA synthetase beta chain
VLPKRNFDARTRAHLVALGFSECLSTPMLPQKQAEMFHTSPVEVMNPLTVELQRMRPSIIPNLLDIARHNERYGASGQRLFEMGNVFHYSDTKQLIGKIAERTELALLIKDNMEGKNPYNAKEQKADIYSLRGAIEHILAHHSINLSVKPFGENSSSGEWTNVAKYLSPDETLIFSSENSLIGIAGKLNSTLEKEYDLRTPAFVAVIDYEKIHDLAKEKIMNPPPVSALPKFPAVERDIALTLPKHIAASKLMEEVQNIIPKELCENIRMFDEFESKEMKAASERSLGVRITFRAQDRTLEDTDVDTLIQNITETLQKKLSARLRS